MSKDLAKVKLLLPKFTAVQMVRIPRTENARADALAPLSFATKAELKITPVEILLQRSINEECIQVMELSVGPSWIDLIRSYLEIAIIPDDTKGARRLCYKAARYVIKS